MAFGRSNPSNDRRAQAWGEWVQQRNPLAVISLVLGVLSLIELGALIVPGVASIVLGMIAIRQIRMPDATKKHGRRLAWTGIVLSVISLGIAGWLYTHRGG